VAQKNRREKKNEKEAPSQTRRKNVRKRQKLQSFFITGSSLLCLGGGNASFW
jgi:hypothetical protein